MRSRVDLTCCVATTDGPGWVSTLSNLATSDLGVLALRGPNGVSLRDDVGRSSQVSGDTPGLLVLGLIDYASKHRESIALAIPPVARHLPLLAIAARTLAKTLADALDVTGRHFQGGVLFISPDLDIRSRYCDLFVGGNQIDGVHPGSRLRPQGDRVPLTSGRPLNEFGGVCFYLPRGELPVRIDFKPSLVLIDLRYSKLNRQKQVDVLAWIARVAGGAGVVCLYSTGDSETRDVIVQAKLRDFPLDQYGISAIRNNIPRATTASKVGGLETSLDLAVEFLNRKHRFVEVTAGGAESIFENIGTILDSHSVSSNLDLRRARWLLATMRQLPVPLPWYEQTASAAGRSTLRRMIARIGVMSRHEGDLGAVLQSLRVQFDLLYRSMDTSNARSEAFANTLRDSKPMAGNSTLVIARDSTVAKAIRTWIDLDQFPGEEWLDRVTVISCGDVSAASERRYSTALICGILPRRYRWIVGAALADEVILLTYPHETEMAERQLRSFFLDATLEAAQRRRDSSLSAMGCSVRPEKRLVNELIPPYVVTLPAKTRPSKPKGVPVTRVTSLADLAAAVKKVSVNIEADTKTRQDTEDRSWRSDGGDDETLRELEVDDDTVAVDSIEAIRVDGSSAGKGRGFILLTATIGIECVLAEKPDDLTTVFPAQLGTGDVMLLMEEGGRTDLFDRIVELAEGSPQLEYLGSFRKQWRDALKKIEARSEISSSPDYFALLSRLQEAGAPIQNWQTARNWIVGVTIGPDDKRSIVAIGKVSGVEALVRNASQFDQAFRKIRGIRQGIGRQLSAAIRRHFAHFATGVPESNTRLDARLGVPLDELIETIDFMEVLNVAEEPVMASPGRIGRFTRTS